MAPYNSSVTPVDIALGGDADQPGIAQPITLDEIRDIYIANRPIKERQLQLETLHKDLTARHMADSEAGFDALLLEIERGFEMLSDAGNGSASPEVLRKRDTDSNKA